MRDPKERNEQEDKKLDKTQENGQSAHETIEQEKKPDVPAKEAGDESAPVLDEAGDAATEKADEPDAQASKEPEAEAKDVPLRDKPKGAVLPPSEAFEDEVPVPGFDERVILRRRAALALVVVLLLALAAVLFSRCSKPQETGVTPTPTPTVDVTPEPSPQVTPETSPEVTLAPTEEPSAEPTVTPTTPAPEVTPSARPTIDPNDPDLLTPTPVPSLSPAPSPTVTPLAPTTSPAVTQTPAVTPTRTPGATSTLAPTRVPVTQTPGPTPVVTQTPAPTPVPTLAPTPTPRPALSAPTFLTIGVKDSRVELMWKPVEKATGYEATIEDLVVDLRQAVWNAQEGYFVQDVTDIVRWGGQFQVKIRALGDAAYSDSAYLTRKVSVSLPLSVPDATITQSEDGYTVIGWKSVTEASGYELKFTYADGEQETVTLGAGKLIYTAARKTAEVPKVLIRALGEGANLNSAWEEVTQVVSSNAFARAVEEARARDDLPQTAYMLYGMYMALTRNEGTNDQAQASD